MRGAGFAEFFKFSMATSGFGAFEIIPTVASGLSTNETT
jgi:hypothetical protein